MSKIIIKKPGVNKNVIDCTDQELIYSSEWNNWKIYKDSAVDGTVSLTVPNGGDGYIDIFHSLGYVPACEIWIYDGSYNFLSPGPDPNVNYQFDHYIDNSKISVYGKDEGGGSKVFIVKYKIYYERIL